MGLLVPISPGFTYQPMTPGLPTNNPGVTVTPGNNTKGSYVDLLGGSALSKDVMGIQVVVHANNVSGSARDTLLDIGADPAGGTAYSVIIPDLLVSSALGFTVGGGLQFYFPLFIKAGTTLAARASVNNATVGTLRAGIICYGAPRRPDAVRCGSFVDSFGITAASSRGTLVTPGVSSAEGTYTQLGSNTTKRYWWWQMGLGINDATMTQQGIAMDLAKGDASNKDLLVENELFLVHNNEYISKPLWGTDYSGEVAVGQGIYGRMSTSAATNDTQVSMAAYGVGGTGG